ncbi:hypothetical protein PV05_10060 [Exophiala xenobiotica]|uniref:Uncharacterized protein n=1 Tax=Exophiala xenobiotica TaxID=348802 RepID=A0A0D2E791_9EURO|nr:uncharacterized protein PV05_10060 [Exophiala xenobiotica]KIW51328.1 hypothetical protein PV05_10060 [Exophiala xenobiotica]
MLRRKPTALTITSEDIASFEEQLSRKVAYARYLKTGEDPEGLFRSGSGRQPGEQETQMDMHITGEQRDASSVAGAGPGAIDPNDELKPLPGDKARIVRSREDRIMGAGSGAR